VRDDEFFRIREGNQNLRSQPNDKPSENILAIREKELVSNSLFEKEVELLKTIDKIRTKLYHSIMKGPTYEKESTLKSSHIKTRAKGEQGGKEIKKDNVGPKLKDQKVRKAYGEAVLERENACILNQGLSTSYSGFHWNADQSLKLTRNI